MPYRAHNLILGVGNILRRDDGVGVWAAWQLMEQGWPQDVEILDGGTAGFDLAIAIENRRRVIVIDAIDAGLQPGALIKMNPADLRPSCQTGMSLHDFHVLDALSQTLLLRCGPREAIVIAVQVADTSAGIGLSDPVQRAMPSLLQMIARELNLHCQLVATRLRCGRPDVWPRKEAASCM